MWEAKVGAAAGPDWESQVAQKVWGGVGSKLGDGYYWIRSESRCSAWSANSSTIGPAAPINVEVRPHYLSLPRIGVRHELGSRPVAGHMSFLPCGLPCPYTIQGNLGHERRRWQAQSGFLD